MASAVNGFTAQSSEIVKLTKEFRANRDDKEGSKKRAQEILKLQEEFFKRGPNLQVEADRLKEETRQIAKKRLRHIGKSFQFAFSIEEHLSPLIDEITIAMKSELGLWVDEHWYKGEMNKRLANVLKVADGWIEKLDVTDEQKQWIRTGAHSI
jgi:hypothetical protein